MGMPLVCPAVLTLQYVWQGETHTIMRQLAGLVPEEEVIEAAEAVEVNAVTV